MANPIKKGRPLKQGLIYFPLNVDFLSDIKVRKILRASGPGSIAILISLLGNIYRDDGYYIGWDLDMPFLIADELGVSEGAVAEVVNKAVQVGFFNKELYEEYKILTSKGIQERFWVGTSERTKVEIIDCFCLLEAEKISRKNINLINRSNNSINRSRNLVSPPENEQSKENESKENENNHPVTAGAATPPRALKVFAEDGIEYKSTAYLIKKILEKDPGAKVPKGEEGYQKWCVHIDRILRIDKRPPEVLRDVLVYAATDPWWSAIIRSTQGLRKHFDTLNAQMKRPKGVHTSDTRNENPNKNYEGDIFED